MVPPFFVFKWAYKIDKSSFLQFLCYLVYFVAPGLKSLILKFKDLKPRNYTKKARTKLKINFLTFIGKAFLIYSSEFIILKFFAGFAPLREPL
jgi:hypothetical protein